MKLILLWWMQCCLGQARAWARRARLAKERLTKMGVKFDVAEPPEDSDDLAGARGVMFGVILTSVLWGAAWLLWLVWA